MVAVLWSLETELQLKSTVCTGNGIKNSIEVQEMIWIKLALVIEKKGQKKN